MNLSSFSVRRAVLTSMLYLGVVGFGLFSYFRLPQDMFPDLTFPVVVVVTEYSGAGPQDVEQLVTRPIEAAVASVEGVEEVRSTSKYGVSVVNIEFSWETDMTKAETDIRKNIDLFARSFLPEEAKDPITFAFDPSLQPVVFLMVSGPAGPAEVRRITEDFVEPRLERIAGVASANSAGGLKREIRVELNPERLRSLLVDPAQVVQAVRQANLQLPGGSIRQGGQLLTIDTKGRFLQVDQIKDVIVVKRPEREIRVKDVAEVRDWFEEQTRIVSVEGKPAVMTFVRKQSDANTVVVVDRVLGQISSIQEALPAGYKIKVMFNQATIIKRSLGNVLDTGWQAFLLAGLVLLVFLFSLKAGLIVATAIPISLLVTFSAMDAAEVTLNMLSMSGLALAIGLLVDNAIVVLENIFRHYQMGKQPMVAAVDGAKEVSTAIMASTLTTLSVFIPVLFVPGIAGVLFRDMVLTICFSLAASLAVAVTLIPMLASRLLSRQERKGKKGWWARRLEGTAKRVGRVVDGYGAFLRGCLRFRKTTLLIAIGTLGAAVWLFTLIGIDFFAKTDQGRVNLEVVTDSANSIETTKKLVAKVQQVAVDNVPEATLYSADVGAGSGIGAVFGTGEYGGRVRIKLPPMSERDRHQQEIERELRKKLEDIPGVEVRPQQMNLTGEEGDIQVIIYINDLARGRLLGDKVKKLMQKVDGVEDVKHSMEKTSPEINVRLNRDRLAQLGTNPGRITSTISTYFMGSLAGVFQEKGDEYNIMVRFPEEVRKHVDRLKNAPVFIGPNIPMPLATVATIGDSLAPSEVSRQGQRRVVKVSATVTGRALGEAVKDVRKELEKMEWPADSVWAIGGTAEDMQESFGYMVYALAAAVLLVYMVMASQFESLLEPFVILFSIPLAAIGVSLALYLTDTNLTITAAIGGVMLVGIVVNNSIVLIDYLKQQWDGKWDTLIDATVEAGKTRLRPILMTTLTTILAMVPLALGIGEGSETWAPMARAVIGGLTTSMLLTLVVVPAWYVALAGFRARFRERRAKKRQAKEQKNAPEPSEA
jgi:HAE1 family hydrophobic/amphiphilic exporter-1